MKKAAIYIRVSTDAQAEEGYSIEAQKEQLTAYCVAKGIKDYEYYIDGGWSGSNIDRPEITRLIDDVNNNKISHVIIFKLDRLSRSQKDTLYLIEDVFKPKDVSFISLNENLDTSTPMGMLMIGILSAFAQLERENIFLRTRMGMKERVKKGYWMGGGRIPFGYDYDSQQGILIPNNDAGKVKELYQLYINGYSLQTIANILGLKYEKLAQQIIVRKCNYGMIEYNGEIYQGLHEPIIDKETYDKAMSIMDKRKRNNLTTSKYLLTGLCYCSYCGAKLRYMKWGEKHKLCCYSHFKSKPYLVKDPDCPCKNFDADEIESLVLEKIFKLNEENNVSINEYTDNTLDILTKQKNELTKSLRRLYDIYASGEDDILLETINNKKKQLNDIINRIKTYKEQTSNIDNKKNIINRIRNLESEWDYITDHEKQTFIRMIVDKITVYDDYIKIQLMF